MTLISRLTTHRGSQWRMLLLIVSRRCRRRTWFLVGNANVKISMWAFEACVNCEAKISIQNDLIISNLYDLPDILINGECDLMSLVNKQTWCSKYSHFLLGNKKRFVSRSSTLHGLENEIVWIQDWKCFCPPTLDSSQLLLTLIDNFYSFMMRSLTLHSNFV